MVGREHEIADLARGLDDAIGGNGRLFLVAGEAGIGKTTLAREAAALAASRGFITLSARGWEGEGAPAYWPFIQVFRALLRDHADAAQAALSPERVARIGALVPEIPGALSAAASGASQRFALFDASAGWLREVASKKPLFVFLDDLHAVDPSSLSMLNFIGRELRSARVVVLAAYREREARGLEVEVELAKLVREGTHIVLGRLEKDAVTKMIEASKGVVPPVIADLVYRTSEGVPLFVEEVLRTMSTPGAAWLTGAPVPAGLRSLMQDRLARLDEGTRRVLEIASVVGRTFTLGLVSLLSPGSDVHELVERSVAADVVERLGPGRYFFAHAMIREALYREIAGGARAKLHAAIIDAFVAGTVESTLAERAHHALRAAPVIGVQRAVVYAREAADAAMKVHAFEDAADLLRRALAVLDLAPADDTVRAGIVDALAKARPTGEPSPVPAPSSAAPTLALSCEGELRTARFGGSVVRLKDSRGLQMLAQLVERPGEEIHALALSATPGSEGQSVSGDSGEVLDREAISAYRERLVEVEEEQREAEAWNDAGRIERARAELELLRAELSRAVGLGGRTRRAGADAERARVNCQRRIRDAVRRIAEQDALIGRHLLRAVRTGTFCAYLPEEAQ